MPSHSICQSSYHLEPCLTATSSRKPSEILCLDEMPHHSTTHSISHFLADCFRPSQAASCFKAGSVCCLLVSPEPSPGQASNSDGNKNVHIGFTWVYIFSSNWSYNILPSPPQRALISYSKEVAMIFIYIFHCTNCLYSIWNMTTNIPSALFSVPYS